MHQISHHQSKHNGALQQHTKRASQAKGIGYIFDVYILQASALTSQFQLAHKCLY